MSPPAYHPATPALTDLPAPRTTARGAQRAGRGPQMGVGGGDLLREPSIGRARRLLADIRGGQEPGYVLPARHNSTLKANGEASVVYVSLSALHTTLGLRRSSTVEL